MTTKKKIKIFSKDVFAAYLKRDQSLKQDEVELVCSFFQHEFLKKEEPLLAAGNKYKKIVFIIYPQSKKCRR